MRAFIQAEVGGTPELTEFVGPECAPGERLRIRAAGLNPFDAVYATGKHAIGAPEAPYVVGREGIGETEDGRRVYFDGAVPPFGALADQAAVRVEDQYELHPDVGDGLALALGAAGIAAWLPLVERAKTGPGDHVVILGATGSVGSLAVQLAGLLGARRVVAVGRRAQALDRALATGADAAVRIGADQDLAAAIAEAAEGQVDVVLDMLWGEPARAALRVCSPHARFVQIGSSAQLETAMPANPWRSRWVSILGYSNFLASREQKRVAYGALLDHAARGRLTVDVEERRFQEIDLAWGELTGGPDRKLVIRVSGRP